jgi:hypothetical protein
MKKKELSPDELAERLVAEHAREMKRKRAAVYNFGWYTAVPEAIVSKTSKGKLSTEINARTGAITHEWYAEGDVPAFARCDETRRETDQRAARPNRPRRSRRASART